VTPPVLWLPQNEIANSPSNPVLLEEGTFADQMLFGDVTYGGLQRAYLDEVEGQKQGVAFRHTAGLEAGVNRTLVGPDGALYVGGIGEAGNWSESGKLRYGLQKLVPNGESVFDMTSVEITEAGFDVTYTEPLSDETVAGIADAYELQQWRYVPTQQYGGPKVDEESLLVTGATVSEDRRTVSLTVDGREPGHVVHLRSPRSFTAADGEELWSTEAWYTANVVPGYVAPPDLGWYEAEEAVLRGGAVVDSEHNGYSGTGFAGGFWNVGASVTFTATVDEAGVQPVHLRYANGPNPAPGTKEVSVLVNGTEVDPGPCRARDPGTAGPSRPGTSTSARARTPSPSATTRTTTATSTSTCCRSASRTSARRSPRTAGRASSTARSPASPSGTWPARAPSAARPTARSAAAAASASSGTPSSRRTTPCTSTGS